jgi:hypothetical protein
MKAILRQGAGVPTRGDSRRLRPPSLPSDASRQPSGASVDLAVRPSVWEGRNPFGLFDVWGDAALAVAAWLVLLTLALATLLAVSRTQPTTSPGTPRPSEVVAPNVSEVD